MFSAQVFSDCTSCHSTSWSQNLFSLQDSTAAKGASQIKCIYSVWSAGVWVAMIHTAVWESLGFTLPLALFTRITEHKWIKKSESHVAWFSLLCKNSHFPSKTKPGSDCYRPPCFAQASTLYTHLAYLWRTLPTTRNTQFSIKHYSSFKKAPAKPCNDVRNSNWISSLMFGEKKLRQNAWTKETAFPRTLQKFPFCIWSYI